jgi:hypothetical protein
MHGCCFILLSHSHDNDASFIALQKINNMYFAAGLAPGSSGPRVSHLATNPQLLSELWYQHLGHPVPTQLSVLFKYSTGLSSQLTVILHPMHSCQAYNDDKIRRAPLCPVSDTTPLLPGTGFHLDFGFVCASFADFGVSAGNLVVTSYDGYNSYLIIMCEKARQQWMFCQASKSPPIFIVERFLALNGLKFGPLFLRMDQGGEIWLSNELR